MRTLISLIFLGTASLEAATESLCFKGIATTFKGDPAYIELHSEIYKKDRIQKAVSQYFYSTATTPAAELRSHFEFSPALPNYTFRSLRSNYNDEVVIQPEDKKILVRRQKPNSEPEEDRLEIRPNHVSGQGFHHLVRNKLSELAKGEVLHIRLVFPSRLTDYNFRIRSLAQEGERLNLRLEMDNWFLRLFAPYVEADYDMKTRRLLRYRGPSNIRSESGQNQNVEIVYLYDTKECPS